MLRKKENDLEWLEFELLQKFPEVKYGVFLHVDLGERGKVEDQKRIADHFGVRTVKLKQVHKDALFEVKKTQKKLSYRTGFDGMVTKEKNVGLLIRHADCQATLFYDPLHKALANVHCGWRGSTLNIYEKTVKKMEKLYGTHPKDLHVCIGPSLGPESAEFIHYKKELPPHFWAFQVRPTYFDFWAISEKQLKDLGVPSTQIEIARICTKQNTEDYFSYRRNKNTPHHGTLAFLI